MDTPTWRVVGTSLRGTSHEKTGQPCQDAAAWRTGPMGWLVAAVADGAGSAALAEVGAEKAAQTALQALQRELTAGLLAAADDAVWETRLTDAVEQARQAVDGEATARGVAVRDLASTLILAVACPGLAAVAQIGDGAAVVADDAGAVTALSAPAVGEFLNETVFLVSPKAAEALQVRVWRGNLTHLALFSDGLQMLALKMPAGTPHAPFFAPLFRFASETRDPDAARGQLAAFLNSAAVRQRTDDDLSLILAALR